MTQQSHLERPAFTRDVNLASGGLGASIVSVSVGTSTSARAMASASLSRENGRSSWFSSTLNNSPMRASTEAGSLRVTTTTGFLGLFIG